MFVFNTQMHCLTFVFVLLELMMFSYQLVYYFSRPQDKTRKWYLILLMLLIIYNLAGGLLPDPEFKLPLILQNILAYGSGFLMAAYFPFYFYKGFNLKSLKFHALYGAPLLLLFPFLIFFVIIYPVLNDLDFAIKYGMIAPFLYSQVLLVSILNAIRLKVRMKKSSQFPYRKVEMVAVYLAVVPWVMLSVFSYFHVAQWVEVLFTNTGFIGVTVLFMVRSAALARIEHGQLMAMLAIDENQRTDFKENCRKYDLTKRETEIAMLLCQGITYKEIAETLFRSEHTVESHVHNILKKTGAKGRIKLLQILGFRPASVDELLPVEADRGSYDKTAQ